MSGGKKKSGFQITSVTSEYGQKEAAGGGGGGEGKSPLSPKVSRGPAAAAAAAAEGDAEPLDEDAPRADGGAAGPKNGPAAALQPGAAISRFRVVRLDQGPAEQYKRGRWTCRDSYDHQEADVLQPGAAAGRLADSARLPQSLDSRLEAAGLVARPQGPFSPQPPRRGSPGLQSQLVLPAPAAGSGGHQARSLGGGLPGLLRPSRSPPSPASLRSPLAARSPVTAAAAAAEEPRESPEPGPSSPIPSLLVEEHRLPKSVAQLIQREAEERRKVLPRQCHSRPSSPAPPLFRDASPSRRTSDPFGATRFSLARSMFGAAHDSDEDSGTNSSMIAIDNKIEQAMDLVKSHLMFAVREEVEVLREQIKELLERNAALEQENALLRSLANAEQLSRFQAQLPAAKPPPGGSGNV